MNDKRCLPGRCSSWKNNHYSDGITKRRRLNHLSLPLKRFIRERFCRPSCPPSSGFCLHISSSRSKVICFSLKAQAQGMLIRLSSSLRGRREDCQHVFCCLDRPRGREKGARRIQPLCHSALEWAPSADENKKKNPQTEFISLRSPFPA